MNEKELELMRSLVAAQAALWDVIDDPEIPSTRAILAIVTARIARLSYEITQLIHQEN
jgi:selenophosphate synthase